jgi:hypothetical protein
MEVARCIRGGTSETQATCTHELSEADSKKEGNAANDPLQRDQATEAPPACTCRTNDVTFISIFADRFAWQAPILSSRTTGRTTGTRRHGPAQDGTARYVRALQEQVTAQLQQYRVLPRDISPARSPSPPTGPVDDPADWPDLLTDLPSPPIGSSTPSARIYKLAKELKRRAVLMTAGRDVHDIHTVLHLAAHWEDLQPATRAYVAHKLRLLCLCTSTSKGRVSSLTCLQSSGQTSNRLLDPRLPSRGLLWLAASLPHAEVEGSRVARQRSSPTRVTAPQPDKHQRYQGGTSTGTSSIVKLA